MKLRNCQSRLLKTYLVVILLEEVLMKTVLLLRAEEDLNPGDKVVYGRDNQHIRKKPFLSRKYVGVTKTSVKKGKRVEVEVDG